MLLKNNPIVASHKSNFRPHLFPCLNGSYKMTIYCYYDHEMAYAYKQVND